MSAATSPQLPARSPLPFRLPLIKEERQIGLKISSLDAWRGFACLAVVCMHACMPTILNVYPALAFEPIYALSLHGGLGVPIFFCISGFCIANAAAVLINQKNGWKSYVLARFRRIYPPYFFASLVVLALTILVAYAASHHVVASSVRAQMDIAHQGILFVVASALLLQIPLKQLLLIGPVWSLNYEVAFYGIVLVAMMIVSRAGADSRHLATALHVTTLACLGLAIFEPKAVIFPFNLWPEFGIGVVLFDVLAHRNTRRPLIFGVLVLVAIAVDLWLNNVPATKTGENSTLATYSTCILVALIIWQTQRFEPILHKLVLMRLLSRIGVFSYSLYLIHEPITGLVLQVAKRLHFFTEAHYPVVFVLQVVISVAVGYGFYKVFEAPFVSKRARAIHAASV